MAVDPARVKSLFLAASELSDAGQREAYLDRECRSDLELRARVEALLRASESEPELAADEDWGAVTVDSEVPSGTAPTALPRQASTADSVIAGKYTLVDVIGEGGMGTVWRAKQTNPVKRLVAVKLIKPGMDSKQVMARFEAERQALALMDHPNIAKVLDGGLHENRPYFVMELVKGVPITEFCDARRLTPRARLELFVPVCEAIQHAHQKGLIHRDIKPSNVLVALYDDKPVVKVIDFGVAKATGGTLTEATIDTGFGGVVGTPQYMSPEQATLNNLDIDTRSDLYALGVLLYELLVGSTPFSQQQLEKRGLLEILRVVREEEPSRPSTKLSTADALPTISAHRNMDPKKLQGLLRNELDWIVMKALEKDRTRRYETANGFAADVRRYLAGEAVHAHPPSAAYRMQKLIRRHKGKVLAASLLFLALLAGVIGTSIGMREAQRQEARSRQAEEKTREQRDRAIKAEAEARLEASRNRTINDFLIEDLLTQADPEKNAQESRVTLLEVLDRAADNVGDRFEEEPEIEAALRLAIGQTYFHLSSWEKAERQMRAILELSRRPGAKPGDLYYAQSRLALVQMKRGRVDGEVLDMARSSYHELRRLFGPDDSRVHSSMNNLASIHLSAGEPELALPLFEEVLKLTQDDDSDMYLTAMNNLAVAYEQTGQLEQGLKLLEDSLEQVKARYGSDHPDTLTWMSNLGEKYLSFGREELGFALLEEAFKLQKARLGPDHSKTLATMGNLAAFYHQYGHLSKAMPLLEETFQRRRTRYGHDHPVTLNAMGNLAWACQDIGQLDKAMSVSEELLRLSQSQLGPDHPSTLINMKVLAAAFQKSGKLERAMQLLEQALGQAQNKLGRDHPTTLAIIGDLGATYSQAGRQEKAIPLKEESVRGLKDRLGIDHPETLTNMSNLAKSYLETGQQQRAQELYEETLKASREKLGAEHFLTLAAMNDLADLYRSIGQVENARALHEEAWKTAHERFGADHPKTLTYRQSQALDCLAAGEVGQALKLLEPTLSLAQDKLGPDHTTTLDVLGSLASVYTRIGQPNKALPLYENVLRLTRAKLGPEHPATLSAMNLLGEQYRAIRQADKAQMLHEEAFQVARERLGADHPDTLSYMNNLALDYQVSGQLEKFKQLLEECLKRCEATLGSEHSQTVNTKFNLALAYWSVKEFDAAIALHTAVLSNREPRLGRNHPKTQMVLESLGTTYKDAGRWSDALPFVEEVYQTSKQDPYLGMQLIEIYANLEENEKLATLLEGHLNQARKALPEKSPQLAGVLAQIGMTLLNGQRWAEAEPLCRECLAIREQAQPDAWTTFNTKSMLGDALLGQRKFEEAESLLLAGYQGMKSREEKIPPPARTRLNESLERLVRLYVALEKAEEAAKWQAELDQRTAAESAPEIHPPDNEPSPTEIAPPGK